MTTTTEVNKTNTTTARELIEFGVPRSYFWNTDINKKINTDILIVGTLVRMYNTNTIKQFVDYFGDKTVERAFKKYKNRVNDILLGKIKKAIDAVRNPTLEIATRGTKHDRTINRKTSAQH